MGKLMAVNDRFEALWKTFVVDGNHSESDYFGLIRKLLQEKKRGNDGIQERLEAVYRLVEDEIITHTGVPVTEIKFGTSGWRGVLGKDISINSVKTVTTAIIKVYESIEEKPELKRYLGVTGLDEARHRGCLLGFDNRFGGALIGRELADFLLEYGFNVYYCGETTTGVMSAAQLKLDAAFSINLTPSHNPLEYGGYKFNAADAGPAAADVTRLITTWSRELVKKELPKPDGNVPGELQEVDSFALWQDFVRENSGVHGIVYDRLMTRVAGSDIQIVIDSMHGASRLHMAELLGPAAARMIHLRAEEDVSFGGIAPEPSSANMTGVVERLNGVSAPLKIGAIIDPDGDRIRFTDGTTEIAMNQFGALAYYFLHEEKGKKGMVAKTVATSNMANSVAAGLGEDVFEPPVGFKEFKPVIGKALVFFEESDGISIIGHTPEKDAYIGLLLALDMMVSTGKNLGQLLEGLEKRFGIFCPDRDGVEVQLRGEELLTALQGLERYEVGVGVTIGPVEKRIKEINKKDGRKMIFEDGSWIMIRPSGTEPKVRFYVESRDPEGTKDLVATARLMLREIGVLS